MISPKEIMKGSVVSFDGKPHIVSGIAQYIMLEGKKEWIGGSLIDGELIDEDWLSNLGFTKNEFGWESQEFNFTLEKKDEGWWIDDGEGRDLLKYRLHYVHQLQNIVFALNGEHIRVPKNK